MSYLAERKKILKDSVDMGVVASVILGGGQGSRLFPLTETRCKPAMPFGGKYRLIDIPLSNSIHSDCRKIFVVTQFLSAPLHKHIIETYRFDAFSSGFVELLTAEKSPKNEMWFQGTADAIRQSLDYLIRLPVEYFLILSGDQIYRMDFREMVAFAKEKDADVTVATLPIDEVEASRMGLMKTDENDKIVDFCEKPKSSALLEKMRLPHLGKKDFLASMGIYLFKREVLIDLLERDLREDFGKHLIPTLVNEGRAYSFFYEGYWEDVGTVKSFYDVNIAVTKKNAPFNIHDKLYPIFSEKTELPAPHVIGGSLQEVILCEGAVIHGGEYVNSIIGPRTTIDTGCHISHSVLMGHDGYAGGEGASEVCTIGKNCLVRGAILDKGVHLGDGVKLVNMKGLDTFDGEGVHIRDGVIVVTRGAKLPDGFQL
jgi:glucose-1-phosphate adenylyltransferase